MFSEPDGPSERDHVMIIQYRSLLLNNNDIGIYIEQSRPHLISLGRTGALHVIAIAIECLSFENQAVLNRFPGPIQGLPRGLLESNLFAASVLLGQ